MYSVPRQNFAFAVDGLDKTTYTPNVLNQLRNDVVRHVLSAFDPAPIQRRWVELRARA